VIHTAQDKAANKWHAKIKVRCIGEKYGDI
jgi:hypothetical protein